MMKKIFLFFAVTVAMVLTSCTKGEYDVFSSIYGVVNDAKTGDLIPNASVVLSPSGDTKITGSDGQFLFEDVDPQQYTITVQKDGYQTNRKSVTAIIGEKVEVNIPLTSNGK